MSRTVFCKKYQQELEGLAAPPYPGPKGQDIYENVSRQAWEDWQAHQTMLINEKHLSLADHPNSSRPGIPKPVCLEILGYGQFLFSFSFR